MIHKLLVCLLGIVLAIFFNHFGRKPSTKKKHPARKTMTKNEPHGLASAASPLEHSFRIYRFEKVPPSCRRIPQPRSGHRVVCDSRNLYSFGGYNPALQYDNSADPEDQQAFPTLFQELWKFNFATRQWYRYTSRQSLPQELASNAVILKGNTLMVYGGTGAPFGYRCSNHLYVCRLDDERGAMIKIQTTGEEPLPQYGQALIYHHGYLYTIGGTTGFDYTCDIHRLDVRTGVWENVYICRGSSDYEPQGRYRHEVAFDGTEMYVLGGGTAEDAFGFAYLPVFNLETRKWEKRKTYKDLRLKQYPKARRCHGAAQLMVNEDIHVFIVGGYNGITEFNDVWRLELNSLRWTKIETCVLPRPMYFHSCAVTPEGKLFVFGGIFRYKNDVQRSNDVYSAWICVPKLSEICWDTLLKIYPQLPDLGGDTLCSIGIPRNFIQRIQ